MGSCPVLLVISGLSLISREIGYIYLYWSTYQTVYSWFTRKLFAVATTLVWHVVANRYKKREREMNQKDVKLTSQKPKSLCNLHKDYIPTHFSSTCNADVVLSTHIPTCITVYQITLRLCRQKLHTLHEVQFFCYSWLLVYSTCIYKDTVREACTP